MVRVTDVSNVYWTLVNTTLRKPLCDKDTIVRETLLLNYKYKTRPQLGFFLSKFACGESSTPEVVLF